MVAAIGGASLLPVDAVLVLFPESGTIVGLDVVRNPL